ncbi:MAG: signal peptidase I [Candidatus Buchananbacteria bacterium RIFCSPLOWO2_01_FULL_46_12]|uniref:Signal peptidase I n=1 Tax=Candidatus Buchananbacteria bacterium RIFCSPLOWO2_01_FULL_46_12 TaxID=1797546 RepID=A0A1G1YQ76_9BACT|nr:MAG: signal peptidase I [Candidatus Buchananbacteria bacterium RIFCSPLOWO2_01_FULL_46_12]
MRGIGTFLQNALFVVVALLVVLLIRAFVFQPFLVRGDSMVPNFHNGDYLIVDELSYRFLRDPTRGEVIVFKFPGDTSQKYIKRVIGLPGESVEIKEGKVYISNNGEPGLLQEPYLDPQERTDGFVSLLLKDDEYFVMGDNREFSSDSRRWGVLPREDIIGKALIRVFPFKDFAAFAAPTY